MQLARLQVSFRFYEGSADWGIVFTGPGSLRRNFYLGEQYQEQSQNDERLPFIGQGGFRLIYLA